MIGLPATSRLLKALGDDTRLRLLHLLAHEELSGTDLMEILNMGQSRISTNLNLLKEVGLVVDRRMGRRSYYHITPGPAFGLGEKVLEQNRKSVEFQADLAGLEALRERRRQEGRAYFDRVAATFGDEPLPGRTWEGLARALLQLTPRCRYADLGVGDGLLTMMIAEAAESVTAVDLSGAMLGQLEERARAKGLTNVETVEGDIAALPLPDESHDIVLLSQALHYVDRPLQALKEASRILVRGGTVLIIDLLAHSEEWVRERLQHKHLGFTEHGLRDLAHDAGFTDVRVLRAARDPEPPHFMTLVATGRRQP